MFLSLFGFGVRLQNRCDLRTSEKSGHSNVRYFIMYHEHTSSGTDVVPAVQVYGDTAEFSVIFCWRRVVKLRGVVMVVYYDITTKTDFG